MAARYLQEAPKLHEFRHRRDSISLSNVDLHRAARTGQFARQRHAHTLVVSVLANPRRLHGVSVEDHAIVRHMDTDLLENLDQVVNFGRSKPSKSMSLIGRCD
jgi:hypothetical protein